MAVLGFQQEAPLTKGYDDGESTSRQERTESDKLSVLPSLPKNLKGSTPLLWVFHRRDFGALIKDNLFIYKHIVFMSCLYIYPFLWTWNTIRISKI